MLDLAVLICQILLLSGISAGVKLSGRSLSGKLGGKGWREGRNVAVVGSCGFMHVVFC